jgi:20S proteasome alpha/beta subunit
VTVGVGFQNQDFVLLCADTEISRGYGKSQECKIHILSRKSSMVPCACIYAGDVNYMKQVLPSLQRICQSSETKIVGRLKREWDAVYKKSCKRLKKGIESPWIEMLFAIGSKAGPKLYSAQGDIFRPEKDYEIIGLGSDVARSVIEPAYRAHPPLSRPELLLLAASGIKQAKDYVQGCGKKTQCLVVDDTSALFGGPYVDELSGFETDFEFFREKSSRLLLALSDAEPEDSTFSEQLEKFTKDVKSYHDRQVEEETRLRMDSEKESDD